MAETTDLQKLVVSLEANIKGFEKNLARATGIATTRTKQIETSFTRMNRNIANSVSGFGRGFVGGALGALTSAATIDGMRKLVEQAAKIGDVADRVGVTTQFLQQFNHAAEQSGASAESVAKGLQTLAQNSADALAGTNDLAKLFAANNVALKDAEGRLRPVNELLFELAELVRNARSPAEALEIATRALGKAAGPELVTALAEGEAGLRSFFNAAATLPDEAIRKAQQIDDQFQALTRSIGTWLKQETLTFVDDIVRAIEEVKSAVNAARSFIAQYFGVGTDPNSPGAVANNRVAGAFAGANASPLAQVRRSSPTVLPASGRGSSSSKPLEWASVGAKAATAGVDELTDALMRAEDAGMEFGDTMADAFMALAFEGQKLGDVLASLAKQLGSNLIRNAFSSFGAGAAKSGGGSLITTLFGGFRAGGGTVSSGKGYIVGENGPEWFQPGSSGAIVPNTSLRRGGAGGQSVTVVNHNDFRGADPSMRAFIQQQIAVSSAQTERRVMGRIPQTIAGRPAYLSSGR